MSDTTLRDGVRAVNFYRSQSRDCVECGRPYHPCSPRQETCSRQCGSRLGQRRRKERARAEFTTLTIGGGSAVVVPLTRGKFAVIDAADWPDVSNWKWHYHSDGSAARGQYVGDRISGRKHLIIRMHQQIMPLPEGLEPDHKDLNKLNNRRSNLRPATSAEQKMNQRLKSTNTSGFKGVAWDSKRKQWVAYVAANGRRVTIGRFDDKEHAVLCRQAVAKFVHSQFYRET